MAFPLVPETPLAVTIMAWVPLVEILPLESLVIHLALQPEPLTVEGVWPPMPEFTLVKLSCIAIPE